MPRLRALALAVFGRFASFDHYADPAAVGYRLAVRLPLIGAVAFQPFEPESTATPLVFSW